jgi:hypothetical protein
MAIRAGRLAQLTHLGEFIDFFLGHWFVVGFAVTILTAVL